jgi:hypothetical protein
MYAFMAYDLMVELWHDWLAHLFSYISKKTQSSLISSDCFPLDEPREGVGPRCLAMSRPGWSREAGDLIDVRRSCLGDEKKRRELRTGQKIVKSVCLSCLCAESFP